MAAAPMHYCEICATAFFRELDRSMKATARAYFAWVSRILASAPLHQHKHTSSRSWLRRALSCSPSAEGGAGMMMSRSKREKAAAKKREKAAAAASASAARERRRSDGSARGARVRERRASMAGEAIPTEASGEAIPTEASARCTSGSSCGVLEIREPRLSWKA